MNRRFLLVFLLPLMACPAPVPEEEERKTDVAPTSITYDGGPYSAVVGEAFEALRPRTAGGLATRFKVSPALPAGMGISATNGTIDGTPSAVSAATNYTVRAENDVGGVDTTISIEVKAAVIAPAALQYDQPNNSYPVNVAITPNEATLEGSGPFTFTVDPALPAGLSLNTTTGTISGTPTAVTGSKAYTVTATNAKGSTPATLNIGVTLTLVAPELNAYSTPNASYTQNLPITANNLGATLASGPLGVLDIDPDLPTGLSFDTTTGRITGTPTVAQGDTLYTVTATNATGSDSVTLHITVVAPQAAGASYTGSPFVYLAPGTRIAPILGHATGSGRVVTISPALPDGLGINATTGDISGHPNEVKASATYTVTVTCPGQTPFTTTFDLSTAALGAPSDNVVITANNQSAGSYAPSTKTVQRNDVVHWSFAGGSAIASGWSYGVVPTTDQWKAKTFANTTETFDLGINDGTGTFSYENSDGGLVHATGTLVIQ